MGNSACSQNFVKCPFYCGDDGKRQLSCEGIVEDSLINWKFKTKQSFRQQMEIFCCQYYENCEIYRMLMENKYE